MSKLNYLIDLLRNSGVSYHENGRKTHFVLSKCPICSGEDKLYIDKNSGKYICWKCEGRGNSTKGNIVGLTSLITGCSEKAASEAIYGHRKYAKNLKNIDPFSLEFLESVKKDYSDPGQDKTEDVDYLSLPSIILPYGASKIKRGSFAHSYLLSRGIPGDIVDSLDAFEIPSKSLDISKINEQLIDVPRERKLEAYLHSLRVIFPQRVRSKIVGFVSRDFSKQRPEKYKVLNTEGPWRRLCLWNFDSAKNGRRIILCEGIISAIMCGSEAVASYGNLVTEQQIELLKTSSAKEIVIMAEVGAYKAAEGVALKLASFFSVRIHYLPEVKTNTGSWKDCGDYSLNENKIAADEAIEINPQTLMLEQMKNKKIRKY